jgi:hypothetical protein
MNPRKEQERKNRAAGRRTQKPLTFEQVSGEEPLDPRRGEKIMQEEGQRLALLRQFEGDEE